MRLSSYALILLTGISLSALQPVLGFADADAQTATASGTVAEVIVTARKKEESAQDVPISIATLSGDALVAVSAGGADVSFLAARVPSVNVESSFGRTFPRFYIRGLGNTDFDLNASQPVSLVYDEVVFENPVLKGFPVFDVERIEVLRGPQGTLFGRNTPAGIVKFDSVKPSKTFDAYARGAVRSFNGFDLEAAVGGPIAPGFSARASILSQNQGDYVSNAFTGGGETLGGYSDLAGRIQLRYQPREGVDALLNLHARELDATSQLFRANAIRPGGGLSANFDRETVRYDGGAGNDQSLSTRGVIGRVELDLGPTTLTAISALESVEFYGRGDIDGGFGAVFLPTGGGPGVIAFPADTADGIDDHEQISHEIRLAGGTGAWSWVAGLYSFSEQVSISSLSFNTLGGGVREGYAQQFQDTDALAIFGSVSLDVTDRLSLTGGLRLSDEEKDFLGRRTQSPFGAPNITRRAKVGDQAVSWDASATLEVSEDINLYARAARGFRAPAIQGRILFGDVVTTAKSEFVTSVEGGFKGALFDQRLRADITAYAFEIEDQQFTAIGGAGNFNQLLNADKGTGYGFEADLEARPTDQLTLTAAFAYNGTEIKDIGLTVAPCGAPCRVLDPVAGGAARINGNAFPNAPEWTGSFTAEFVQPLPNGGRLFAFTDWAYKGDTNFFLYESAEFREEGFWEGGVRVGYETPDAGLRIAAFGRNVTDEERLVGAIDFNNLTGFVNNPRIWGLEASVDF